MYFLIEDEIVGLKKIETSDDLSNYHKWFNSQESNKYNSHGIYPMTYNDIREFISRNSKTDVHLSIFLKDEHRHIGNISLQSIDFINRSAELAIVIGENDCLGKGYSFRACKMLIDHAFGRLNLLRVYCGTTEKNIGMQKLANKLNMEKEGVSRKAIYRDGEYLDVVNFAIIKNPFSI